MTKGGDEPKTNTALEQAQRDNEIFRAWLRGASAVTLAATFDLSVEAIANVLKATKADTLAMSRGRAPIEIVEDWLLRMEAAVDELAQVSARESGSVRVAAIGKRLEAMSKLIEVMQSTGILPHDLGTLRIDLDARKVSAQLLAIFNRYPEIPVEAKRDVVTTLNPALKVEIEDGHLIEAGLEEVEGTATDVSTDEGTDVSGNGDQPGDE
jgi:hypothetical protein